MDKTAPNVDDSRREAAARSWRWLWQTGAGTALLALALPPFNLGWIAWVALIPWTLLILHPTPITRRQYFSLWGFGLVFWLWLLESIRKAHPALYLGWFALSAYLAVYVPAFIGWSRMLVHKGRWPAWIAIPCVWTGLELVRAYLITGFSLGNLGHTQAAYPALIQAASIVGAYGITFLVALVGASLGCLVDAAARSKLTKSAHPAPPRQIAGPLSALVAAGLVLAWSVTVFQAKPAEDARELRVALVQGSLDVVFETSRERDREVLLHYGEIIRDARQKWLDEEGRAPSLYILPESSFPLAQREISANARVPPYFEGTAREFHDRIDLLQSEFNEVLNIFVTGMRLPPGANARVIVGGGRVAYRESPIATITNEVVVADREGKVKATYAKCHPVMFGEYIPFGAWLPWLYEVTPLPAGITAGPGAAPFEVDGLVMSPSICFESTVPHVIGRHIRECRAKNQEVDALVNITNDGWFWGGAVLDLQAQCNIFRAVEQGKPLFVAANTGLSMMVDANGRVLATGPRRKPLVLVETVKIARGRITPYSQTGDMFAACCFAAAVAGHWLAGRRRVVSG